MQCSPIECAGSFLVRECGDVEIVSYQPVLSCNLCVNVCVWGYVGGMRGGICVGVCGSECMYGVRVCVGSMCVGESVRG